MTVFNSAQVAEKFDTTPRTLRKFLRSPDGTNSTVGKGSRWDLEGKELAPLKRRFTKWTIAQDEARTARLLAAQDAPEVDDDEPTDAMLAEIDA